MSGRRRRGIRPSCVSGQSGWSVRSVPIVSRSSSGLGLSQPVGLTEDQRHRHLDIRKVGRVERRAQCFVAQQRGHSQRRDVHDSLPYGDLGDLPPLRVGPSRGHRLGTGDENLLLDDVPTPDAQGHSDDGKGDGHADDGSDAEVPHGIATGAGCRTQIGQQQQCSSGGDDRRHIRPEQEQRAQGLVVMLGVAITRYGSGMRWLGIGYAVLLPLFLVTGFTIDFLQPVMGAAFAVVGLRLARRLQP